jgi:hypothetical protein
MEALVSLANRFEWTAEGVVLYRGGMYRFLTGDSLLGGRCGIYVPATEGSWTSPEVPKKMSQLPEVAVHKMFFPPFGVRPLVITKLVQELLNPG